MVDIKTNSTHRANLLLAMRNDILDVINRYVEDGEFTVEEALGCVEMVRVTIVEQQRDYVRVEGNASES